MKPHDLYADVRRRLSAGAAIDPARALSPAGKGVLRTVCETVVTSRERSATIPPDDDDDFVRRPEHR